ncbi:MAG: DNA polymerase III subunit delta [Thermotogota bacterium]
MNRILVHGNSEIKKRIEIDKRKDENVELHIITPENYQESSFLNIFQVGSMFSNKKMVVIKNFDKFKDKDREVIAENISSENSPVETLIITTENEKELKNLKIFKNKISAKLPAPWEKDKWRNFVNDVLKEFNKNMDNNAIDYLLEVLGKNDLFIYEEIQKLSIYTNKDFITKNDIKEIVTHFSKPEQEDLAYMISCQNEEKALELMKNLLEDPQFIPIKFLFFLTTYFYDLYKAMTTISGTKKYSWPNVENLSKELKINKNRMRSFCGLTFSNDKIEKMNVARVLKRENVAEIIFNLELLDRELKSDTNNKFAFIKFIKKSMYH